jgi:hypothetical protein
MNQRTRILALLLVLIGVVVVVDRYVVKGGEADETGVLSESARARYEREAALAAQRSRLLEAEPEFEDALGATRTRWGEIRERLVRAPSASLAEAQFRDDVLEFARRQNIREPRTSRIESSPIGDGGTVRLVELVLEFDSPAISDVYAMVDGLENMRGMLTHVSAVDLSGPGRIPKQLRVSARLTVQAIAHVEGEGG